MTRAGKSGFTLVELLVVIAIIGVLAGLLLPVLSNAKTASDRTFGINNMKQIVLAEKIYYDRENGFPPFSGDPFISFLYFTDDVTDLKCFRPKTVNGPTSLTKTYAGCSAAALLPGLCGFNNGSSTAGEPNNASSSAMAVDCKNASGAPIYKGAAVVGYFDGSARAQGPPTLTIGNANGGTDTEKDLSCIKLE